MMSLLLSLVQVCREQGSRVKSAFGKDAFLALWGNEEASHFFVPSPGSSALIVMLCIIHLGEFSCKSRLRFSSGLEDLSVVLKLICLSARDSNHFCKIHSKNTQGERGIHNGDFKTLWHVGACAGVLMRGEAIDSVSRKWLFCEEKATIVSHAQM